MVVGSIGRAVYFLKREKMGRGAMSEAGLYSRAERAQIWGVDCAEQLDWRNWEPGGEYTRSLVVKNVGVKTLKVKYKLPATKYFSMEFPEPIKLQPGLSATVDVTFRPIKRERYDDYIEFMVPGGSFSVPVCAFLPVVALEVPPSLDFGFAASKEECKRSFTFTNVGEVAVDYEWKIDEPFTFTPNAGRLSPGESQNVHSVFLPPDRSEEHTSELQSP